MEDSREGSVGDLAVSGSGGLPPVEPEPNPSSTYRRIDDVLEGLMARLHVIHPTYKKTFPFTDKGYRTLQKVVNEFGYPATRRALERCIAGQIVPRGQTAVPLVRTLAGKEKA